MIIPCHFSSSSFKNIISLIFPPLLSSIGDPKPETPNPDMSAQTKRFHLHKQHSWSPDAHRDEAWLRRRHSSRRRTKSVTDDDLDELKACIELGFGFSPEKDPRLTDTIPALDLYYAVNKQYNDTVSKSSNASDCDPSDVGSPKTPNILPCPGDGPDVVKTKLKQWAQVVACSVRQSC
ncbi:hypothetical protein AAC387_Pa04g2738 [Persea americana]